MSKSDIEGNDQSLMVVSTVPRTSLPLKSPCPLE